jgi:cellobiose PTS system EIIC component
MEVMAPLFDQPHLASVRDGFASLLPLLIVGATMLIILQFPCNVSSEAPCYLGDTPFFTNAPEGGMSLADKLWVPFNITFGLLSVYVTATVSYALSRRRGLDPLMPVLFALASFILVASPQVAGGEPATRLDNSGLFTAILISLISVEVYRFFIQRNLVISMPAGVPPAISNAFAALVPGAAIILGWWVIRFLIGLDIAEGLFRVLSAVVPAASSFIAVAIAETFHAFLWTMGIHGDLTIGIVLSPIWTANLAANAQAVADGGQPTAIYTSIFRTYVVPGGSGATLPLAIYFIRSKAARLRRVGWLGIWPGIFNINEPITFGAPIIFNPVLAIPFILITLINATVAYLAHTVGLVRPTFIEAPWTLPAPLLMLVATGFDFRAFILATITEFVIPAVIWFPAFKAWERQVLQKEGGTEEAPVGTRAAVPAGAD